MLIPTIAISPGKKPKRNSKTLLVGVGIPGQKRRGLCDAVSFAMVDSGCRDTRSLKRARRLLLVCLFWYFLQNLEQYLVWCDAFRVRLEIQDHAVPERG